MQRRCSACWKSSRAWAQRRCSACWRTRSETGRCRHWQCAHCLWKEADPKSRPKKCIVNEFLAFLGAIEVPDNETQRPVVRLLVGDTNISYDVARECAAEAVAPANAQTALDRWVPVSTTNKLSGDVMWCCGAFATEMVIPVGKKLQEEWSSQRRPRHRCCQVGRSFRRHRRR